MIISLGIVTRGDAGVSRSSCKIESTIKCAPHVGKAKTHIWNTNIKVIILSKTPLRRSVRITQGTLRARYINANAWITTSNTTQATHSRLHTLQNNYSEKWCLMTRCFLVYSVLVHSHHVCIYGNQKKKGNVTRREICRKLTFTRVLKSNVG